MMRKNLQEEVQHAKDDMLILGSLVEQAMADSTRALKDHDFETSKQIQERDQFINQKRFQIEADVIAVIATQHPIAQDLRVLTSILDICNDLERMGDYAKGIATINLRSGGLSVPKILRDIEYMANKAVDMLHRSLTAFIHVDLETAQQIAREDNLIDSLYEQIYFEVMDFVVDNPTDIQRANYVLWAAHNIERMADRVTNICERTVFVVTGELGPIAEFAN